MHIFGVLVGLFEIYLINLKKMGTKEEKTHQEFLNSLRQRLNVDEATIVHLERRLTGKFLRFPSKARQK